MTVLVGNFTDWPLLGRHLHSAYPTCSPNLKLIGRYLDETYGSVENGCHGVRDNRAGTADSSHSYGAAGDRSFRWVAPAIKRSTILAAIEDLKSKSKEWHIQAIHDYMGCRIWRSNRNALIFPDGWKIQKPDASGMGKDWADWIHVETTRDGWADGSPLAGRFANVPPATGPVRPRIGPGSRGDLVVAVQYFLTMHARQDLGKVDGIWGPRTSAAWTNFHIWTNAQHPGAMTTDGYVDGVDWNVIAWVSGGWDGLYNAGFPRGV